MSIISWNTVKITFVEIAFIKDSGSGELGKTKIEEKIEKEMWNRKEWTM